MNRPWDDADMLRPIAELFVTGAAAHQGYAVGRDGVTRISRFARFGLHNEIPYVRVHRGDEVLAEFCLHNVIGIQMGEPIDG